MGLHCFLFVNSTLSLLTLPCFDTVPSRSGCLDQYLPITRSNGLYIFRQSKLLVMDINKEVSKKVACLKKGFEISTSLVQLFVGFHVHFLPFNPIVFQSLFLGLSISSVLFVFFSNYKHYKYMKI